MKKVVLLVLSFLLLFLMNYTQVIANSEFKEEYFPNHYNSYIIYFAITHKKPIGCGY